MSSAGHGSDIGDLSSAAALAALPLPAAIHREGPVVRMQTPKAAIFACSWCHNATGKCSARVSMVK